MSPWTPIRCAAALAAVFALQSCTTRAQRTTELPLFYGIPVPPVRLAQIDGHPFSLCPATGCPRPTPKVRPSPRSAISPPPDAALARDERSVAAPQQPSQAPLRDTESLTVSFEIGSARLTNRARVEIDTALARTGASIRRLIIRGRTDATGSITTNERLAQARANAVREHIAGRQPRLLPVMSLESHGACCYVAPNDHAPGRARNRRVEIEIERGITSPPDDL